MFQEFSSACKPTGCLIKQGGLAVSHCSLMPDEKQLMIGLILAWLQSVDHHGKKAVRVAGAWDIWSLGIQSGSREREWYPALFFSFYSVLDPSRGTGPPMLLSGNSLTDMPKFCLLGDYKSNQLDNDGRPHKAINLLQVCNLDFLLFPHVLRPALGIRLSPPFCLDLTAVLVCP